MKKLHAPWRARYTKQEALKNNDHDPKSSCVFCSQLASNDDKKHFILKRYKHCTVMLNLYPYNAGHLLILANKHAHLLSDLKQHARAEIIETISTCTDILNDVLDSQGTNIGCNLGKVSGAGIPAHLHVHILPRWPGDTNFMPTIAQTKVISFDLVEIYKELLPHFKKI